MAGAEAERRHLPCADYLSLRGFLPRSGISCRADLGTASAAERIRAGRGYGLGCGGALAPRGTVRVFVVFEPDTGLD